MAFIVLYMEAAHSVPRVGANQNMVEKCFPKIIFEKVVSGFYGFMFLAQNKRLPCGSDGGELCNAGGNQLMQHGDQTNWTEVVSLCV